MNTVRKHLLLALAAVSFSGAAFAQSNTSGAPEPGRHAAAATAEQRAAHQAQRHVRMAEQRAKRSAALHAQLKLTPQQEPAFAAYMAAAKPTPHAQTGRATGQYQGLTAPQRLEQRIAREKALTAHMEARLTALNNFYAVLTPEQKKVLDSQRGPGLGSKWHRQHGEQRRHHGAATAALPG